MADLPTIVNKVVEVDPTNITEIRDELNDHASKGFRLVAVTPSGNGQTLMFFTNDSSRDWSSVANAGEMPR